MKFQQALALLSLSFLCQDFADGHGAMIKPRARNVRNYQLGNDYDWKSVNENEKPYGSGVAVSGCGRTQRNIAATKWDYDEPPFAWNSEETYTGPNQVIEVEVVISAHHEGFFEFFVCDNLSDPNRACFEQYPLEFVSDSLYGAPYDSAHPTRAYIPVDSYPNYQYTGGDKLFRYQMKLPSNVPTGSALLQWRYSAGNTCQLESGYTQKYNTFWPGYPSIYSNLAQCLNPLPDTRTDDFAVPERFWNCAEVTIGNTVTPASPPPPTPPTNPASTPPSPIPGSSGQCFAKTQAELGSQAWATTDAACAPCANGQTWWPCNTAPALCACGGSYASNLSPTPPSPTPPSPTPPSPTPSSPTPPSSSGSCCENGFNGMKPANNCGGFVQCLKGVEYPFTVCPSGLLFDSSVNVCNHANQVTCSSSCTPSRRLVDNKEVGTDIEDEVVVENKKEVRRLRG